MINLKYVNHKLFYMIIITMLALKVTKPGDPKHCFMQCPGVTDKTNITSDILVNAAGEYCPPMILYKR